MKIILGLMGLGLVVLGTSFVCADPPRAERKSGKVLILPNQRTLEGDIERLGDRFRIRRNQGELWIPAEGVLCLCSDWNDAFAFMAGQSNLLDPDERIRLAKWCHANGLNDLALREIHFALELRPKDSQALRFKEMLDHLVRAGEKRNTETVTQVNYAPPPALDVGVQSLAMFASRVQPILTNTCLSCHQAEKDTRFRLFRVTQATYRNALENNLVAALAQIDTESPELSPLLCKAVSRHGGDKAPLNGRDTVPFQTLQAWVYQVIESNPHLRAKKSTVAQTIQPREVPHTTLPPAPPSTEVRDVKETKNADSEKFFAPKASVSDTVVVIEKKPQTAPAPQGLPELPATPLMEMTTPPTAANSGFARATETAPVAQPASTVPGSDVYDPSFFNRKMHPLRQ